MKSRAELHVVVGAGIAGCLSALFRRRAGYHVVLLERNRSACSGVYPVCTETSNIVSENHSGAEYPFDQVSAEDCLDARIANEKFFPDFVYGGKDYSRILASQSMVDAGIDILAICRRNMEILRSRYERRCLETASNRVFGDSSIACREVDAPPGVRDVAGAFVTPQRGLNPVFVAAALEAELKRMGVEFREGCDVTSIDPMNDGRFRVQFQDSDKKNTAIVADQVSLCLAANAFSLARKLNPSIELPKIFATLREILYVSLPDGTEKTFTCLKLENEYGGMLSPLNDTCAMVYYPPAAHIMNLCLDPASYENPPEYHRFLLKGHPEQKHRAALTMQALRRYYPELARAEILGSYLKVAINTVADSRVRRNLGVFQVMPACTMTVLAKWTMCVVNVLQELDFALEHSCRIGTLDRDEAEQQRLDAGVYRLECPREWSLHPETFRGLTSQHAINMKVPHDAAKPMLALTPS